MITASIIAVLFPAVFDAVEVSIGQTAVLPCHIEIQGQIQVVWKDKDQNTLTMNTIILTEDKRFLVLRPYQSDWNLQIAGVKMTDTGNYTCCYVINTNECTTNRIVPLVIQIPPSISSITEDVTMTSGGSVTLRCVATGIPQPTIKWVLHRTSFVTIDLISTLNGEYKITNAKSNDSGRYECIANNGVLPVASKSVLVVVNFKPRVIVPYREVRQAIGSDTLLDCLIRSNPVGDVYWEINGGRRLDIGFVSDKYRVYKSSTGNEEEEMLLGLIVNNLVSTDFTWYLCIAKNNIGTAMDSAILNAYHNGTLKMISTPKNTVAQSGQNQILIDCSVDGMNSDDQLTWWRLDANARRNIKIFDSVTNDVVVAVGDDVVGLKYGVVGRYNLIIKNVVADDEGLYFCDIRGFGNYSAQLTVISADSSLGSNCDSMQTASASVTAAVISSVVVVFIIILVVIVWFTVRYYRRRLELQSRSGGTMNNERYYKPHSQLN